MTTYFYYNHEFLLGNLIISTFGLRRKSIAKFLEHLYIKNQHGDGRKEGAYKGMFHIFFPSCQDRSYPQAAA